MKGVRKNRVRRRLFKSRDVEMLIEQVKLRPVLWNFNVPLRGNSKQLSSAWDEVAIAIGRKVNECKSTWSSLRASMRYHLRNDLERWEHKDSLSFLINRERVLLSGATNAEPAVAATTSKSAGPAAESQEANANELLISVAGEVIYRCDCSLLVAESPKDFNEEFSMKEDCNYPLLGSAEATADQTMADVSMENHSEDFNVFLNLGNFTI